MKNVAGELLRGHPILKGISISGEERSLSLGEPLLAFSFSLDQKEERRKFKLRASPESFFQINPEQNQALIQTVLQFGDVKEEERVLDLYAGIGNFSLPFGSGAREVVGVEENKTAVEDARFNAKENRIDRCKFLTGRTEEVLRDWTKGKPDLVILDPPRAGGKRIAPLIAGLSPRRIVYISCDPATLSRDLRLFAEEGYPLQKLTLIDMFPQTYHMEVVALLVNPNVA
jgi:23S rRNA (uracil1939-C5)-methyltransferase